MANYRDFVSELLEKDYETYETRISNRNAYKTRSPHYPKPTISMKERAEKVAAKSFESEESIKRIKIRIMENRLRYGEVAYVLGLHESTLSRWLRPEWFDGKKEQKINEAIDLLIEAIKNTNEGSDEE